MSGMRVGVVSTNNVQTGIMLELLKPLFGDVQAYDKASIANGEFARTNVHLMVLDYSDATIFEMAPVADLLNKAEPKIVLTEKSLHPLSADERIAWRRRIVDEALTLLPVFAGQLQYTGRTTLKHDLWVIGASTGGPEALTKLFSILPTLPISIIVVQHISNEKGGISLQFLLSERQKNWAVSRAEAGLKLEKGHVYLAQRDHAVTLEGDALSIVDSLDRGSPSPSINATLRALHRSAVKPAGVMILTGLGDDGTAGIREAMHSTMRVFAQSAEDSALPYMPEAARRAGVVNENGSIEELASLLVKIYS